MLVGLDRFPREDKFSVAVGTLDLGVLTHLEIDARVAKRPAAAVAGNAAFVDGNDFGSGCRHG